MHITKDIDTQLADITNAIVMLADLDFNVAISLKGNEVLDAISVGLLALGEELKAACEARQLAEKANQSKEKFIHSMNHELRAPLTMIMGCSEILQESALNKKQMQLVQQTKQAALLLQRLVNDILEFNQIEAGILSIQPHLFDLENLLYKVISQHESRMIANKITFKVEPFLFPKGNYLGDGSRIEQVLHNVLNNVIKYTLKGEVSLSIQGVQENRVVHFTIEIGDDGMGIERDEKERLLERFAQLKNPCGEQYDGMGIGLHISRVLLERMGGSISVTSRINKGSVFTLHLTLPLMSSSVEVFSKSTTPLIKGKKILVLDNDATFQSMIRDMLEMMGCLVENVFTSEEALSILKIKSFDLVFMNHQIPFIDGMKITRQAIAGNSTLRIVALTTHVSKIDVQLGEKSGLVGHLQKPFTLNELKETVLQFIL